jgi:hypothetical protein
VYHILADNSCVFNLHGNFRVLDNLKDYAARALVNAVDHLGTVAYKLTDLIDQQTLDVSTMDLKITTINQVGTNTFEISC